MYPQQRGPSIGDPHDTGKHYLRDGVLGPAEHLLGRGLFRRELLHRWIHAASGCESHLIGAFFKSPTLGRFHLKHWLSSPGVRSCGHLQPGSSLCPPLRLLLAAVWWASLAPPSPQPRAPWPRPPGRWAGGRAWALGFSQACAGVSVADLCPALRRPLRSEPGSCLLPARPWWGIWGGRPPSRSPCCRAPGGPGLWAWSPAGIAHVGCPRLPASWPPRLPVWLHLDFGPFLSVASQPPSSGSRLTLDLRARLGGQGRLRSIWPPTKRRSGPQQQDCTP